MGIGKVFYYEGVRNLVKENTLILVKPDGLMKSLTGNILSRLSESKLVIIGTKMTRVTPELAYKHYEFLKDEPFFGHLLDYIMGKYHETNRVMALVYQGPHAIKKLRHIVGSTNPEEANPVSIRGAYGRITTKGLYENVVHASANRKEAKKEIELWFTPDEIVYNIYPTKQVVRNNVKMVVWK